MVCGHGWKISILELGMVFAQYITGRRPSMRSQYFLLGAMLGAIAGILYAPKSGKKTQETMRRYYFEMKDNILENMGEIKDITRETHENVVDSVVAAYEQSKIITSWEASRIKDELKAGYERMKKILQVTPKTEK